jgi:hypothetical protein
LLLCLFVCLFICLLSLCCFAFPTATQA